MECYKEKLRYYCSCILKNIFYAACKASTFFLRRQTMNSRKTFQSSRICLLCSLFIASGILVLLMFSQSPTNRVPRAENLLAHKVTPKSHIKHRDQTLRKKQTLNLCMTNSSPTPIDYSLETQTRCRVFLGSATWAVDSRGVRCRADGGLDPLSGCCHWLIESYPSDINNSCSPVRYSHFTSNLKRPTEWTYVSSDDTVVAWRERSVCEEGQRCCSEPSLCVSCCFAKQRELFPAQIQRLPIQIAELVAMRQKQTGSYFDACVALCRTTSAEAYHQNRYRSPFHHCYERSPQAAH